ncbi:MAG: cell division protein ZapA [Exilibacterium sp.]
MTDKTKTVIVNILDKDYQVACPANERDALLRSARELDRRMRTIRDSGNVIGLERIAVMAALNLCHELLQSSHHHPPELNSGVLQRLSDKLDQALESFS